MFSCKLNIFSLRAPSIHWLVSSHIYIISNYILLSSEVCLNNNFPTLNRFSSLMFCIHVCLGGSTEIALGSDFPPWRWFCASWSFESEWHEPAHCWSSSRVCHVTPILGDGDYLSFYYLHHSVCLQQCCSGKCDFTSSGGNVFSK